ncbi:MAG: 50S ribosomal protein L10 [Brevinemataceae bacterium]
MLKKAEKIKLTETLSKNIAESDGFVLCSFQGLSVAASNQLRRKLFEINAQAQVIKNRLLKHALHDNNISEFDEHLKNSTMIVLGREDSMAVVRALGDFAKENDSFTFKAGVLSKTPYSTQEIIEISKIPGRIELIAMIAGGLNSVLSIFNGTLEALAEKKEKE